MCLSFSLGVKADEGDSDSGTINNPYGYIKASNCSFQESCVNEGQYVKMTGNQSFGGNNLSIFSSLVDINLNNFILTGGGLTTNPSGNKVMLNIKNSTASTEYIDDEIHYTAGIIDMGQVGIQDDSTSNYDAK